MSGTRLMLAVLAVAAVVATSVLFAAGPGKKPAASDADRLKGLEDACERLAKENRELGGHLRKTKAELSRTQELIKSTRGDLEEALNAFKVEAEKKIKETKEYNLRVEWKLVEKVPLDENKVIKVDFGRPVVEATAFFARLDLAYPDTDRYVRRFFAELKIEKSDKENEVHVRHYSFMHDNNDHRAKGDYNSFVVFARVRDKPVEVKGK